MSEPNTPADILHARVIRAHDVDFHAATRWLERRRDCDLRELEGAIRRLRAAERELERRRAR